MTTTVRVTVEGNKACEVFVVEGDTAVGCGKVYPYRHSAPAEGRHAFVEAMIHGDQSLEVREMGDFL